MKLPTFSCAHIKQSLDLYVRPEKKNIGKVQNTFINKKNFGHNWPPRLLFLHAQGQAYFFEPLYLCIFLHYNTM
jgi:hypothetical protein